MALFGSGTDPRDALIASQASEIDFLRGQVKDLQDKLIAVTDKQAHAMLHRPVPVPRQKKEPAEPRIVTLRQPIEDIEAQFALEEALSQAGARQ
jgi:predicted  nucleic acid-binding Zn-ribbon protein